MFIKNFKSKHYIYHGAIITEWNVKSIANFQFIGQFIIMAL